MASKGLIGVLSQELKDIFKNFRIMGDLIQNCYNAPKKVKNRDLSEFTK